MSGESSRGVGGSRDPLSGRERQEEERATEEQAARWAQILTPHVIAQLPPLSLPSEVTPGGWRAGDGVLTPEASQTATPANLSGSDESSDTKPAERIVVNVQTSDLGELSLVVERTASGVRVVVGVGDAQTIGQMLPEREALMRQLVGTGLNVDSIQIVPQSEVGTVLAPPRFVGRIRTSSASTQVSKEEERLRRRGSRKLNLVG
ncbi:MAG TPA: hypothetical protein VG937_27290 [Polyangiaceae bacterium]|nr:hypothetical protein [Polyangiaceae bacterium]